MSKSDLHIDILGTDLTISADETPEYLETLLEKFRRKVENVESRTGIKDPLKIAVLSGFLLCDDLEKAGVRDPDETPGEAEQLTLGMISLLDGIVPPGDAAAGGDAKAPKAAASEDPCAAAPECAETAPLARVFAENFPALLYKLKNTVKHYRWGSEDALPEFLGLENPGRIPWAELWMGVNSRGPSRALLSGGEIPSAPEPRGDASSAELPLLSGLIDAQKEAFLGGEIARKYGKLPFLFKVLAAARPLSIQAHPSEAQARAGFERENLRGIPLDAPERNYRDPNHKSEIICALTPFTLLSGFREVREIIELLEILSVCVKDDAALNACLEKLLFALEWKDEDPLKAFLTELYAAGGAALEGLGSFIKSNHTLLRENFSEYSSAWDLCVRLAELYPAENKPPASADPGVFAPLYLNIIQLHPGEAVYIPAGVLHSYLEGMGLELMADSDNVLRGGLSSKHVDAEELFRILDFSEYRPEVMKVPFPHPAWYTYPAQAEDFTLSVMRLDGETKGEIPASCGTGPCILIVTEGSAALNFGGNEAAIVLEKGESVFIPAEKKSASSFSGSFTAYLASV